MKNIIFILFVLGAVFVSTTGTAQIVVPDGKVEVKIRKNQSIQQDVELLEPEPINSKVCLVMFAGEANNLGRFHVQVNPVNSTDGYSSPWPDWAYAIAKDAFLHDKKVWVIFRGDFPWGSKLMQVHLINR